METLREAYPLPAGAHVAAAPAVRRSRWRRVGLVVLVLLVAALGVSAFLVHDFANDREPPAVADPPNLLLLFSDLRPVHITITTRDWEKVREVVTVDRLRTDRTLWREMHFGDWDTVPPEIREPALMMMIDAYAPVLNGPFTWQRMTAREWDDVPQPIRAMAYLRMIWYWARIEEVGTEFGYSPDRMAQSIGGIVMAESWFEHRAVNENQWGNRDLGLAQCSDHCREKIEEMAANAEIAFNPSEADYFDPWLGTRIATVWFERELHRAGGDVELAIRAYHRGIDDAMDEKGDAYLTRVVRLREQYVRTQGPSPTWRYMARHVASL